MKMVTDNYSHTLLSTWRRCRYKFKLKYIDGISGPGGIGMVKGSAGHAAMAEWHTNWDADKAMAAAWEKYDSELIRNGFVYGEPEEQAWEELVEALGRYFPWSETNDQGLVMVKPELEFHIHFGDDVLKGYIDAVVQNRIGHVWLMEHKFLKRVSTGHLDLDPQVGIYMLAAKLLGYDPQGVMYNIVRVGGGPTAQREPVVRKLLYRNPEGLTATAMELQAQISDIHSWLDNPDRPIYRTATKDCTWDCPFYNVCLAIEDTGDGEPVLAQMAKESD